MDVRPVWVRPGVGARLEEILALVDQSIADDVVRRWMAHNRVHEGCTVLAVDLYVDGVNDALTVWVVVTDSGFVRSVTDPPIAISRAVGPARIRLSAEPT
jgi:hypothetical protein